jgi:Peptidase family C25.
MKKTIVIFSSIFVGTLTGIAQPMTDMRIVSEDQHSVVLEFTPHIHAEHVSGNQGTIFTRFRFFESQITYDSTGRTDFIRAVLLLLPSPQYSLQVLASEYQIKDTVKMLPKPTRKALKDFGVSESYDDTSFARTAQAPGQNILAELIRVGQTSIGCVGTLLLHPVQTIDKEKVKIYSRIVVRLNFTDAFPAGLVSSCLLRGSLPQKAQLAKMAKVSSRQSVNENFPLAQGEWYRIEVTETGMYKLDYNYFRSLNISISDINSIRLYGNGGLAIPDDNTSPRPNTLLEIPRLVVDKNGNGIFDPDDYVVFYGRGVRGWHYIGGGSFQHYINPFTEKNYYFFTVAQGNGKQMDTISASAVSPPTFQPTSFQEKIFKEEETYNLMNSGRRWVGKKFTYIDNSVTYNKPLPGLVASSPITYRFKFLHRSTSSDYLDIFEHGQPLSGGSVGMGATDMGFYSANEVNVSASRPGGVPDSASTVKIQVSSSNQDAETYLDWMEIYYQRRFEAVNDTLLFTSPDVTGSVQYDISNFSSDIRAFDVTDHNNVKELKYYSADPTVCTIQLQQTGGSVREIAVVGKTGFKIPAAATKIENTINLHNVSSQYDFIIISPPEFLSEANRLKAHRESQPDPLNTLVVDINQIYSEFSGGLPDILAIREFLRYTQANWMSPVPQYVLLFGWGHYDYKKISTNQPNWIPPYETAESFILDSSYPSDDEFVLLGSPNALYSIAIGRLPVRSVQEASVTVNKIISYETSAPTDTVHQWRNSLTFVADDGLTSTAEDDGSSFTDPTEALAESNIAKSFDKNKIYIVAYPTVNSASGRRKPDANKAIVDAINQGTLYTNYIGHGNDQLWAHEYILTRDGDLPKLFNRDRLTFVVAGTCSFGLYDNPTILSGGEQLVTMEQGGAIGSLVTSRIVYNDPNIAFNNSFFYNLLAKDSTTGTNPRLGDAVRFAKSVAISKNVGNTQKFHLFGDPTLRLLMPKNVASVDSVNGRSTSSVVAMKSLGHVPIRGTMKLDNGTPMTTFQGKGTLQVFDSQREVHIVEGSGVFDFKANGSLLYRGGVSITHGQFKTIVPIPKDVTFGNQSRISMYAWNDATDGAGYTENIMINGIDSSAAIDTTGPQISIYLNDLNFRPGDVVKSNDTLIVRLNDESGINTSTAGVGHQLSATINNPDQTIDLSNYYQSDFDTYKSGEVRYPLPVLSEGKHSLRIKAWDIQNNSSEAETYFEVSAADDLTMLNVVNYPNPFSNSTTFTFQRNIIDPINVEVKIFSIAGRLIGKMSVQNITDRSVKIPWDGRDNDGDRLANGIYLYKLIARSQNGQHTSETIGKLAVVR